MKKRFLNLTYNSICFLLCGYTVFFLQIGGIPLYAHFIEMEMTAEAMEAVNWDDFSEDTDTEEKEDYIKWMAFQVPLEAMNQAYTYDVKSYDSEIHMNWIELLSYCAAKNWGVWKENQKSKDMDALAAKLQSGEKLDDLKKDLKLYDFYYKTYSAVLKEFVGEYEVAEPNPDNPKQQIFVKKYGLKVFSPLAKGYAYTHYDDFGVSRTYGYNRKHQGHDMMGSIGSPVIAVEGGVIEALGWNQYGGWRIGIRSHDKERYYYYAHLRKDHPFHLGYAVGDTVQAGDVIGYLGRTGYSVNENVNNIKQPHLHFGIQIIFDESQKDGVNQIWLDCYNIVRFLAKNKMPVTKATDTKDFNRSLQIQSGIWVD